MTLKAYPRCLEIIEEINARAWAIARSNATHINDPDVLEILKDEFGADLVHLATTHNRSKWEEVDG